MVWIVELNLELPDRMRRGRPLRRFMYVLKEDMQRVSVFPVSPHF